MKCPSCERELSQEQLPEGAGFCPLCGEKLGQAKAAAPVFCPFCGQKLPPEALFCPRCGRRPIPEAEKPREGAPAPQVPQPVAEKVKEPEKPPAAKTTIYEDIRQVLAEKPAEPAASRPHLPGTARVRAPLWPKVKLALSRALQPVNDFISGRRSLKKLYQHWVEKDALPREEMPTAQTLTRITREAGGEPYRPLRLALVVLGSLALVGFFIGIGVWIAQC